ncbi:MAG: diacylglycerol kinase [Campylobacteraceae bacterium]|nr:diacylglycerol kinase [Campylobacteraceae bacterium]
MKPKHTIIGNFIYAIDGCKEVFKEKSFKIEVFFFIFLTIVLIFLSYPLWAKIFMFLSMIVPLLAEIFNTAIEKTVDLAEENFHSLAKAAKDVAAFGAMVSISIPLFVWFGFIAHFWKN